MAESSQNVESALCDAFQLPDPAPKLIELIRAHPQRTTINDLVALYTDLATEHPTQIDKFAQALAKPDLKSIILRELADILSGELANLNDLSVTSSNDYLITSLLSATSRKYRLSESPAQVGAILSGLYYNDRKYACADRTMFEVLVLGACLQLLASGSYLYGPEGFQAGKIDVLAALESIKKEGVVKNPTGFSEILAHVILSEPKITKI